MTQRKTWSTEEDNFIRTKVQQNTKLSDKDRFKWGDIADLLNKQFPDSQRSGKQCRQRWHNQLDPNILHKQWTQEEEKKLFELQKKLGNKWAEIASNMKGRTDNNVKNYFYSTLRKSLRKLNTFISLNRLVLKAAKQFKQSSLSKLLAVADHKFDKKINVKKVTAQIQAVEIKNLLVEITRLQVNDVKSAPLFLNLVKKLQEWNKCCKKKKGKKKQEVEIGEDEGEGESGEEEEQQVEEEQKVEKKNNRDLERSGLSQRSQRIQRSRSRNNKMVVQKKQSNVSKNSRKSKATKKPIKQEKKKKQSLKVPETPQMVKGNSSKQPSNLSASMFLDLGRSSLDLGKYQYQRRPSGQSMNASSNLFKSFIIDNHGDPIQQSKQKSQKNGQSKVRVTRSSSQPGFLDMIKEVSMQRRQSQRSSGYDELLQEDDYNHFFGIKMLKRQSSRRELPMVKDESFMGFGGLEQSYRFEPQIRKLRSWRQDSSNFQMKYEFGDDNAK